MRRFFALFVLLAAVLASRDARADDVDAAAEALFEDARHLMADHHYAEACGKLAASQRLDPGLGTLLNLADCHEKTGKTASAWADFREAAGLARAARQYDREAVARARSAALEARLARLTLVVATNADTRGFEVLRDGLRMDRALYGVALPIDPGPHVIEARAPGKLPYSALVDVPESKPARVTLRIPELADAPASRAAEREARHRATRRTFGYVALGAGVASLAAGSLFAVRAIAQNTASASHCRSLARCDADGVSLREDAFTSARWSTVTFVAGAVLLGGGAALVLTAPSDAPRPAVALRVAGPSLSLEGTW
jgi:hypothetical protein